MQVEGFAWPIGQSDVGLTSPSGKEKFSLSSFKRHHSTAASGLCDGDGRPTPLLKFLLIGASSFCLVAMYPPLLNPSLLASDHANVAAGAEVVVGLNLPWLHLDIMDGHFVPNLSFGPETLAALRRHGVKLFFDTHLMLSEPHRYIDAFAKAGSNLISIHIEPSYDHAATLDRIRALGCQCGIVLNPDTPAKAIDALLARVDLVLVMTVQPGFGGQSFRREMLPKIKELADARQSRGLKFHLEVDGGIDVANAAECRAAGADVFVAGTSFFKASDQRAYASAMAAL